MARPASTSAHALPSVPVWASMVTMVGGSGMPRMVTSVLPVAARAPTGWLSIRTAARRQASRSRAEVLWYRGPMRGGFMVATYFASSELAGTCVSGAGWVSSAPGGVLAPVSDVSASGAA